MKCVKDKKTGALSRVANEAADELVKGGTHEYATKREFKNQVGIPEPEPESDLTQPLEWTDFRSMPKKLFRRPG